MNKKENRDFIKKTESLVRPEDVTTISFLGDFNKMLPKKTQRNIMAKGSKKIPYMGFIVDPYCLFLSYKIKDVKAAEKMLPEGYELAETSLFKNEEPYPMVIFCAFAARTSAFIGMRLEMYIIARSKETGILSWIISDYETDTNSHDPKNGFCGYTGDPAILTTTPYGELLADIKSKKTEKQFSLTADLNSGHFRELDADLWVKGNLSVDYGGELSDPLSKPFSLIFDPQLMNKALEIPLDKVVIEKNSYLDEIIDADEPAGSVVFPYSQHFVIRQDMKKGEIIDESGLLKETGDFLSRSGFKRMEGKDIKHPVYKGILISWLLNTGLILFLLYKLLF